jgi:hypothetical protein
MKNYILRILKEIAISRIRKKLPKLQAKIDKLQVKLTKLVDENIEQWNVK